MYWCQSVLYYYNIASIMNVLTCNVSPQENFSYYVSINFGHYLLDRSCHSLAHGPPKIL